MKAIGPSQYPSKASPACGSSPHTAPAIPLQRLRPSPRQPGFNNAPLMDVHCFLLFSVS